MPEEKKKLFVTEDGVRFRSAPNASDDANILQRLTKAQELEYVDGPWLKVKCGDKEGWIHSDYATAVKPAGQTPANDLPNFIIGQANLANSPNTITVRAIINDEFGLGKSGDSLNCTEYVMYRVKAKLGINIKWPADRPRNGGKWADIFQAHGLYKILAEPKANCAMCFTTGISTDTKINEIGHVAFVEGILPDGSIKISEANWPRDGKYNERTLAKADWQNKYKAWFVDFV